MDCSLPGSSVHGIFRARILEQVAISFSRGTFGPRDGIHTSASLALAGGFTALSSTMDTIMCLKEKLYEI